MTQDELLLRLSKKAIESGFNKNIKFDKEDLIKNASFLAKVEACFVTITINGQLRGCIGSLIAHRNLLEDLLHNSYSAAFKDPRFKPLSYEEFQNINIEISILTSPTKLTYSDFKDLKEKLEDKKPGVILELDGKKATYLPSVWEQLPKFEDFISSLCKKAGLNPLKLSAYPNIQTYEAIKIKEQ